MLMFILWNYCERFLAASLKTSRRVGDWWVRESFTHKNKKPDNGPNWTELLAQVCTMGFLLSNYKNLLAIFFYLIFICDSTFGSVSVSPSLTETPAGLCPVSKLCQSKLFIFESCLSHLLTSESCLMFPMTTRKKYTDGLVLTQPQWGQRFWWWWKTPSVGRCVGWVLIRFD